MALDDDSASTSATDEGKPKSSRSSRRSRKKEESSSFSFIHFTGEASSRPGRAQKVVRAQAARASSDRRLATIEKRREAKRANSADPTTQLGSVSEGYDDDKLSPLSQADTLSPLLRARSAPPTLPRDGQLNEPLKRDSLPSADDWVCDLNAIVHRTLQNALRTMHQLQIPCETTALSRQFQDASLYRHPLMIQCIELLATTTSDHQTRPAMSRRVVVLLRHKLIVAVQAIIGQRIEARAVLASVVALLAGWEEASTKSSPMLTYADLLQEHGESHACEYHLRALAGLLPSRNTSSNQLQAPFVDIEKVYTPEETDHVPAGLRFHQSLNLLPTCLVGPIANLADDSQTTEVHLRTRRNALLTLACRPMDPTDYSGLMHRVCCHIRIAAALLAILIPAESSDPSNLSQEEDRLNAWYAESLSLETETALGTVYDEVLIWSLCVFCGSVRSPAAEQIALLKTALGKSSIANWEGLETLLERYIAPTSLISRVGRVLGSRQ